MYNTMSPFLVLIFSSGGIKQSVQKGVQKRVLCFKTYVSLNIMTQRHLEKKGDTVL